jgi:ArsR family transcriptional regulator, arsenate/arsenite/antimonite-responsive transcriptional repressor
MEQTVQLYKALSEEMRLRILMLLTHGELCVCDLMAIFDEPQSKISRHLAYLKNSGLLGSRRVGTWMHYFLKETLDDVARAQIGFMSHHLAQLQWAKQDRTKMEEVKSQKICESEIPKGSVQSGKTVRKEKVPSNRKGNNKA